MAHDEIWTRSTAGREETFGIGVDDDDNVFLDVTEVQRLLLNAGYRRAT